MVVENAFGRLKGQWRCLLKRLNFKLKIVPHVVSSCVVLHNMCEMFGDNCPTEWTLVDRGGQYHVNDGAYTFFKAV